MVKVVVGMAETGQTSLMVVPLVKTVSRILVVEVVRVQPIVVSVEKAEKAAPVLSLLSSRLACLPRVRKWIIFLYAIVYRQFFPHWEFVAASTDLSIDL